MLNSHYKAPCMLKTKKLNTEAQKLQTSEASRSAGVWVSQAPITIDGGSFISATPMFVAGGVCSTVFC